MTGTDVSPVTAALAGMMPLIRTKIMEVPPESISALATLMVESFSRVANDDYDVEEFNKWFMEYTGK